MTEQDKQEFIDSVETLSISLARSHDTLNTSIELLLSNRHDIERFSEQEICILAANPYIKREYRDELHSLLVLH